MFVLHRDFFGLFDGIARVPAGASVCGMRFAEVSLVFYQCKRNWVSLSRCKEGSRLTALMAAFALPDRCYKFVFFERDGEVVLEALKEKGG